MAVYLPDEEREVKLQRAAHQASRGGPDAPNDTITDPQELQEREEAAAAYAGEDEQHFVSFMNECIKTSVQAMTEIRQTQDECWRVYNEEEPYNYAHKELWQARVIYPKPNKLVQFGTALIRKAFDVQFLSVENEKDEESATFIKDLMTILLSRNYANFPTRFVDATTMALAVGQSMEMIPQWRPGKGLDYILIEPWKIKRHPDAVSRGPQSGMYWIHEEYMPLYLLEEAAQKGRYVNIDKLDASGGGEQSQDPSLSEAEIAERKKMFWSRSTYEKTALTKEYWGTILDSQGKILLPNGTFTTAGGRVIGLPKKTRYSSIRWPGMSFSALPDMLRYGGRGLVQGIVSLWYLMCNLMSLHADHLNWMVNPMMEVDIRSLVDQKDTDLYPGKLWQTYGSEQGHQVVRATEMKSQVGDAIAILNFYDQRAQDGGLVDYKAMGAPGFRGQVTAREAAQDLDQSLTIVGSMANNIDDGAVDIIMAGYDTVAINITYEELAMLMGEERAGKYRVAVSAENPTGLKLPQLTTGNFRVTGLASVIKDQEILKSLANMMPMFENPVFQPYLEPFGYLKSWVKRTHLISEGVMVDDEKAKGIASSQQQQQDAAIQAQKSAEAAAAALAEIKVLAERAKAEMNLAKAEEHRGKGVLAHSQAIAELTPQPPEAPGV